VKISEDATPSRRGAFSFGFFVPPLLEGVFLAKNFILLLLSIHKMEVEERG